MRRTILWVFCVLLLLPAGASAQKPSSRTTTITILQLNDVYEISPVDNNKHGGLARVATLIKQERARSSHTLFLLAGDFISPSLASGEFKGKQMIDTLNAAGLDIATLGLTAGASRQEIEREMAGHVLDVAELMGRYRR